MHPSHTLTAREVVFVRRVALLAVAVFAAGVPDRIHPLNGTAGTTPTITACAIRLTRCVRFHPCLLFLLQNGWVRPIDFIYTSAIANPSLDRDTTDNFQSSIPPPDTMLPVPAR